MTGSPAPSARALDAALTAHHGGDPRVLSRLHRQAADLIDDPGATRFHLTQAWIFALEAGDPTAAQIEAHLRDLGGL